MAKPWAKCVKAILQMGYVSEGAGKALADLLFGTAYPGGKLAATHQRLPLSVSDGGNLLVFPR